MIEYNEDQKKAIEEVNAFFDNDEKVFVLKGPGGTGKTFVAKELMNGKNALFIAPTHKAKAVLSQYTGSEAITLASSLAIKLNESTGKFQADQFKRRMGDIPISKKKFIVIDECSMISDQLVDEIIELSREDAKIICLGDEKQLPAVGQESDSKIFHFNGYNLTTIVRQKPNSSIRKHLNKLRQNIASVSPQERILDKNDESLDFLHYNQIDEFIKAFCFDVKLGHRTKIVTYNNHNHNNPQSVKSINATVRDMMGYTGTDYMVGEPIMAYDRCTLKDDQVIEKATDYLIVEMSDIQSVTVTVTGVQKKVERNMKIPLEYYEAKIKDTVTGVLYSIQLPSRASHKRINDGISTLFKNRDYFMGYRVREAIPNFEHGYACSSHSSQGSTYERVYVLEDNVLGGSFRSNKEKNQSLYVAVSRAKDTVSIHSEHVQGAEKKIGFLSLS